jgi:hypothetical protein
MSTVGIDGRNYHSYWAAKEEMGIIPCNWGSISKSLEKVSLLMKLHANFSINYYRPLVIY